MMQLLLSSFLSPHFLEPIHRDLIPCVSHTDYNILLLLLCGVLLYVFLLKRNTKETAALFHLLFDLRILKKSYRTRRENKKAGSYPISWAILTFLCFSLLLYRSYVFDSFLLDNKGLDYSLKHVLLFCLLFCFLLFCFKWLTLLFTSKLLDEQELGRSAIYLDFSYTFSWVIFAFPFLALSFYLPNRFCAPLLIGLCLLYLFLRIVFLFRMLGFKEALTKFSYLHIFLYICALESLPFLCLYKILSLV